MPVLEEALVGYLATELAPLVDDRLVPMRGEAEILLPYVTYQMISESRLNDHDAFGTMKAWVEPRFQFRVWSHTIGGAKEVGEAIVTALNGYHGDMNGLYLGHVRAVFGLDGYQQDVKMYWHIVDFIIPYQEGGG